MGSGITIRGFDGNPIEVTHEQLSQLGPVQLDELRRLNTDNQDIQNVLGNYHHRSMNRYITNENPMMGTLMAGLEAPYAVAKGMMGMLPENMRGSMFGQARSQPSVQQVYQGMLGTGEGYMDQLRRLLKND